MKISIHGAKGRMGQQLVQLAGNHLFKAVDRGDDLAALAGSAVIIDFSTPEATAALLNWAAQQSTKPRLVIGTTGLSPDQELLIKNYAQNQAVVYAANYSLGVNVLNWLIERAAQTLPPELFDIEIFETHHNQKVDAPSGTALMLGQAAAKGRNIDLATNKVAARDGHTGVRATGHIGFSVARGGDVAGEHTAFFFGQQERLELTHRATDRAIFARGAVHAASWVLNKPPGQYDMQDVLGLVIPTKVGIQ